MTRPTKRGVWQAVTVVLLAAATAGIVVINDMTQSPRSVASSVVTSPSPQLVGEASGSRANGAAAAPSWLVRTAISSLTAYRDTTPSSAYWGYAPASKDAWGIAGFADSRTSFYWLVFTGDFWTFSSSSSSWVARGHSLVLAVDATDHSVTASALSAKAAVDPSTVSWLHSLHVTAGED